MVWADMLETAFMSTEADIPMTAVMSMRVDMSIVKLSMGADMSRGVDTSMEVDMSVNGVFWVASMLAIKKKMQLKCKKR